MSTSFAVVAYNVLLALRRLAEDYVFAHCTFFCTVYELLFFETQDGMGLYSAVGKTVGFCVHCTHGDTGTLGPGRSG